MLESLVGPWGAALINLGLVVSVGGAFLSWTLLCAEIPYICGKDGTFPRWFAGENAAGSPVNSLWVTNGLIQLFLLVTLFAENAYQFLLLHRLGRDPAALCLLRRLCAEAGALRRDLWRGGQKPQSRHARRRPRHDLRPLARLCAGLQYLLMCMCSSPPAIVVYVWARAGARRARLHGRRGADCRGDRGACRWSRPG